MRSPWNAFLPVRNREIMGSCGSVYGKHGCRESRLIARAGPGREWDGVEMGGRQDRGSSYEEWAGIYTDQRRDYGRDRRGEEAYQPSDTPSDEGVGYLPAGGKQLPDIRALAEAQSSALLPGSASGPQYTYYFGSLDTALRRLSVSLGLTFLTVNVSNILAVPAGLYWLWSPVALAARRNAPMRKYIFKGMWRAEVLGVRTAWRDAKPATEEQSFDVYFGLTGAQPDGRVLQLLIGDGSGARVDLEVPLQPEHRDIRVGDIAHLVVVSDIPNMTRFRVVREAYLPEPSVWVSDYPFSERSVFMYISDEIEMEQLRRRSL